LAPRLWHSLALCQEIAAGGWEAVTSETGGRREQKKRETRRALEQVAVELFAERGFDDVTIDEIVAAANVSRRTFYRYYEAKEDVLLSEQRRLLELVPSAVRARPAEERLLDALSNGMRDVQHQIRLDDALTLAKARLLLKTPSLAARMLQHAIAWQNSFAVVIADRLHIDDPDDPRPAMLAAAVLIALRIVTQRWAAGDTDADFADELQRHLTRLRDTLPEL
jgi:AcrR family transcriptional regulator